MCHFTNNSVVRFSFVSEDHSNTEKSIGYPGAEKSTLPGLEYTSVHTFEAPAAAGYSSPELHVETAPTKGRLAESGLYNKKLDASRTNTVESVQDPTGTMNEPFKGFTDGKSICESIGLLSIRGILLCEYTGSFRISNWQVCENPGKLCDNDTELYCEPN